MYFLYFFLLSQNVLVMIFLVYVTLLLPISNAFFSGTLFRCFIYQQWQIQEFRLGSWPTPSSLTSRYSPPCRFLKSSHGVWGILWAPYRVQAEPGSHIVLCISNRFKSGLADCLADLYTVHRSSHGYWITHCEGLVLLSASFVIFV